MVTAWLLASAGDCWLGWLSETAIMPDQLVQGAHHELGSRNTALVGADAGAEADSHPFCPLAPARMASSLHLHQYIGCNADMQYYKYVLQYFQIALLDINCTRVKDSFKQIVMLSTHQNCVGTRYTDSRLGFWAPCSALLSISAIASIVLLPSRTHALLIHKSSTAHLRSTSWTAPHQHLP